MTTKEYIRQLEELANRLEDDDYYTECSLLRDVADALLDEVVTDLPSMLDFLIEREWMGGW